MDIRYFCNLDVSYKVIYYNTNFVTRLVFIFGQNVKDFYFQRHHNFIFVMVNGTKTLFSFLKKYKLFFNLLKY